jgi:hypothetical protein
MRIEAKEKLRKEGGDGIGGAEDDVSLNNAILNLA